MFVDPLAEQTMEPYLYTGNNPDYSLKIHPGGNSETTSITVGHDKKHYYYDKNLKPNE